MRREKEEMAVTRGVEPMPPRAGDLKMEEGPRAVMGERKAGETIKRGPAAFFLPVLGSRTGDWKVTYCGGRTGGGAMMGAAREAVDEDAADVSVPLAEGSIDQRRGMSEMVYSGLLRVGVGGTISGSLSSWEGGSFVDNRPVSDSRLGLMVGRFLNEARFAWLFFANEMWTPDDDDDDDDEDGGLEDDGLDELEEDFDFDFGGLGAEGLRWMVRAAS